MRTALEKAVKEVDLIERDNSVHIVLESEAAAECMFTEVEIQASVRIQNTPYILVHQLGSTPSLVKL